MKFKNIAKNLIVFAVIMAVLVSTAVVTFAVGEDELTTDTTPVVTQETETIPPATEPVTETTTVAPTVATTETVQTEPSTQPVTQTEDTQQQTTYATYATTVPVTSATKAEEIYTKPTAVRVEKEKKPESFLYGIVSWICVIVGVLVVVVVLISNKTTYYGGNGKQRYDEGDRITGQKHLLNDDYYNSRKQSSYYNKDNRK